MKVFPKIMRWALISTEEARKVHYDCDFCVGIIEEAEKMNRPVIAWQTSGISPEWEIVGIWGNEAPEVEKWTGRGDLFPKKRRV
jgi:hypothetical protein